MFLTRINFYETMMSLSFQGVSQRKRIYFSLCVIFISTERTRYLSQITIGNLSVEIQSKFRVKIIFYLMKIAFGKKFDP